MKSGDNPMICFEVQVNGRTVCTAGVGNLGVLSAILSWVKRDPKKLPHGLSEEEWCKETLDLTVGGTVGHGEDGNQFLDWLRHRPISVGDEITIKVLNQDNCDPPANKRIETSVYVQQSERTYYESLKKKYGEGKEVNPG
jgi:hypothetical protein